MDGTRFKPHVAGHDNMRPGCTAPTLCIRGTATHKGADKRDSVKLAWLLLRQRLGQ